ncbi:MAG: hypothetical protein CMI26_11600 [Opitutae bacterium]|jgi:hypothetical protein|nr:hypothetical protein [Opitutae bacterium]|tara:strand:+ start:2017 stop:2955 length:939 start_codon:yes stop_codon:yes gene_type:complete
MKNNVTDPISKTSANVTGIRLVVCTLPFFAAYWAIRAIPVEPCDFLHAQTYNAEGTLDYCGPGDSGFVDLTRRSWPLSLKLEALDDLRLGEPCRFRADIHQFDGSPLGFDDVALSHTKKIHLLAIDPALDDYIHLHPIPDPEFPGVWTFSLTPSSAGAYRLFFDFIPVRSPRRVLLSAGFEVAGQPGSIAGGESLKVERAGYTFSLIPESSGLSVGKDENLLFEARDAKGKPVTLQPVMGAFAHLVAFDDECRGFAHLHPEENLIPVEGQELHSGSLTFGFRAPSTGHFRLWAQVRIAGQEIFVPFDLQSGV